MAYVKKNKLQDKQVSYTIQVKVKNPLTSKTEIKTMRWRKPIEMTERQAQRELERIIVEFEQKAINEVKGLICKDTDIKFCDFADQWLSKTYKTQSLVYANRAETCVKKIKEFFQGVKLKDITPPLVEKYMETLYNHRIEYKKSKLIKDMEHVFKERKIKKCSLKELTGCSRSIYYSAARGNNIEFDNAYNLCKGLGLNYNEFFETEYSCKPYEKATIQMYKKILTVILSSAKKQRLVEHNFASSDYISPVKGEKKEVIALNDSESRILMHELESVANPMHKIAIYIVLLMGIRRSELAGLEWSDIDFDKGILHIQRACYYLKKKLVVKDPKTFTSNRKISIPSLLLEKLKEYKVWYDDAKSKLGDIWANTDKLFLTIEEGKVVNPDNFIKWLRKVLNRCNLPRVTLHSIRHTNITLQIVNGVDIRTVSARAGHSKTSTTTDIYSHFIPASDGHACTVIDNIFN